MENLIKVLNMILKISINPVETIESFFLLASTIKLCSLINIIKKYVILSM